MLVCLIRSVILYLLLILVIRLMGKRQIGEMEPSEFVVTMLIADLASVPMQDLGIPLLSGIIPIVTVLAIEILLSALAYHFILVRKLLCGKPVILMENGKILPENLKKTRLTPDELTEHLREQGIVDLTTVKYAILETNGQVSALLDPKYQPLTVQDAGKKAQALELPITIISSGKLIRQNLALAGRTEEWVAKTLQQHYCRQSDVVLLTVDPSGTIYLSTIQEVP